MKANELTQTPESLVHKLSPLKGRCLYMGARHGLAKGSLVYGEMMQGPADDTKISSQPERMEGLAGAVKAGVEAQRYSMRFPAGLSAQRHNECAQQMARFLIKRGYRTVDFAVVGPQGERRNHTSLRVLLLNPQTVMDEQAAQEELKAVRDCWDNLVKEIKPSDNSAPSASDQSR